MEYQLGLFDRASESWRLHRDYNGALVAFTTLGEAETRATKLSETYSGQQVIVITLHACFLTETEYPPVAPIVRTHRLEISTRPYRESGEPE